MLGLGAPMSTDGHEGGARATTLDLPRGELEELGRAFTRLALEHLSEPEALPVFPETSAEGLSGLFACGLPRERVGL